MARKNSAARRRNIKGRMDRREKGTSRMPKRKPMARIAPEDLVIPDGKCYRNPRHPTAIFATEAKAREALRQAQQMRARSGSAHVEKRYYACDTCSGFHLTSREEYDADAWKSRSAARS